MPVFSYEHKCADKSQTRAISQSQGTVDFLSRWRNVALRNYLTIVRIGIRLPMYLSRALGTASDWLSIAQRRESTEGASRQA